MKPDWKDAPEWAKYLAMDSDGYWYWYDTAPTNNESGEWQQQSVKIAIAGFPPAWSGSLEKRP